MSKKSEITIKRDETIAIPSAEQEKRIGIRYQDWERCKRKIKKLRQQVPRFHLIYSFSFGVSASAASSLITSLAQGASSPSWITFLYAALFATSLIIGILFVFVDRTFRAKRQSEIDDLIEEMEIIEKTFPPTLEANP
jgi:hypothetical protein